MRPHVLRPLRERDFALLFTGVAVSLLGDGIYLVAIAWQVYDISNLPTALSLVGVAWTLPMVAFLLVGGVLADRIERRRLLILSDIVRGVAIAAIGIISIAGVIELWHVIALVAVYGFGQALFAPALDATVPDVVPRALLVQANSLYELAEPVAYRFVGLGRSRGRARISETQTAEIANVAASARNAGPGPSTATRKPPSAARPRSSSSCSWGRARSCCRMWSATSSAVARARSGSSSPPPGSARSARR